MKPRSATIAATLFVYMLMVLVALAQSALTPFAARAQTVDDDAAIRAAALDYIEGWYEGDAARMERAVHPDLVKRIVHFGPDGGARLGEMTADQLIESTGLGGGSDTPVERRHEDVTVLDVYGDIASVRIYASDWVDHLQLAKWNGEWKIVNVLWEPHPAE
jgi:hypothetical protein